MIAGGNELAEEKRKLKLAVLDALLAFIKARQKQREELPKLIEKDAERQKNCDLIRRLVA